jgi:transposase
MAEIEANIGRYLAELDTADRHEPATAQSKSARLNDKTAAIKSQMATLKEIEAKLIDTGETQISLTDPDSRSMMTRGSGIVGYNVQTAAATATIVRHGQESARRNRHDDTDSNCRSRLIQGRRNPCLS